jgi:hypothetical protein
MAAGDKNYFAVVPEYFASYCTSSELTKLSGLQKDVTSQHETEELAGG